MERAPYSSIESRRAFRTAPQDHCVRSLLALLVRWPSFSRWSAVADLFFSHCPDSSSSATFHRSARMDVQNIVQAAASAANVDTMVIAVVDRGGKVLARFSQTRRPAATDMGNFGTTVDVNDLAVALARTAAYFSNDQAPLSSRTVRFISGIHFPPGVANAPNCRSLWHRKHQSWLYAFVQFYSRTGNSALTLVCREEQA